jgi:type II secretory pathway component PulM
MTPLEAHRQRIQHELDEASKQLSELEQQLNPNAKLINYYTDLIRHSKMLLESIDGHLPDDQTSSDSSDSSGKN